MRRDSRARRLGIEQQAKVQSMLDRVDQLMAKGQVASGYRHLERVARLGDVKAILSCAEEFFRMGEAGKARRLLALRPASATPSQLAEIRALCLLFELNRSGRGGGFETKDFAASAFAVAAWAEHLRRLGELGMAEQAILGISEPLTSDALIVWGNLLCDLGRIAEAEAVFIDSHLTDGDPHSLCNVGIMYLDEGEVEAAVPYLEAAASQGDHLATRILGSL